MVDTLAPKRSPKFLPERWTLGQLDMRVSALKKSATWLGHFLNYLAKE
jgi:hypothetical protein